MGVVLVPAKPKPKPVNWYRFSAYALVVLLLVGIFACTYETWHILDDPNPMALAASGGRWYQAITVVGIIGSMLLVFSGGILAILAFMVIIWCLISAGEWWVKKIKETDEVNKANGGYHD